MRRSLLVAQTLASAYSGATFLLVNGTREATAFRLPPRADCLALPALCKTIGGTYHSRGLALGVEQVAALRAATIQAALRAFEPDLFIVDNVPRGALRELDPALEEMHTSRRTRCVLGLRDLLDEPAVVRREWRQADGESAVQTYYDAVWVYGDPSIYDPVREYGFSPGVASKVRYTGYLDQRARFSPAPSDEDEAARALKLPPGRLVLCLVGGGQDGVHLAETFARTELPPETNGVIITGPFMDREVQERLRGRATTSPRLRVLEFVREPALLLRRADRVVAMGGYNTICEILSFEKHALIVPRVRPRLEQLLRAQRLRGLGLIDMLHPDELNPNSLQAWLASDRPPLVPARQRVDLEGLKRLPGLTEEVLAIAGRNVSEVAPVG